MVVEVWLVYDRDYKLYSALSIHSLSACAYDFLLYYNIAV